MSFQRLGLAKQSASGTMRLVLVELLTGNVFMFAKIKHLITHPSLLLVPASHYTNTQS